MECGVLLLLITYYHALRSTPISTLSLANSKSGISTLTFNSCCDQCSLIDQIRGQPQSSAPRYQVEIHLVKRYLACTLSIKTTPSDGETPATSRPEQCRVKDIGPVCVATMITYSVPQTVHLNKQLVCLFTIVAPSLRPVPPYSIDLIYLMHGALCLLRSLAMHRRRQTSLQSQRRIY